MKIAIIGTGKMATGLGRAWSKAGHNVMFGSRDPAARQDVAREVGGVSQVVTHDQAMSGAEVVVLTTPYIDVEPFAREHADRLRGKVVVDITNPFDSVPAGGVSGPEVTAKAIGQGARVVAAFKTNFAGVLDQPVDASGVQRDVFYCGDDVVAKEIVRRLIDVTGFRPVDCGALKAARALDPMVPLMIEMDRRLGGKGLGRRSHWKFVTP
ncbi:MAG: NADP oxidoreductase [Dehalococcoidia bacterium]|nr:NADP oxidoreductase [Dehalococcoidia bacterium]